MCGAPYAADVPPTSVSSETLRSFLEQAPDAVVIIDPTGRIVLVNAQTERLFGYPRDELVGANVEMLLPERFRDAHVHHRAAYLEDPRTRLMGAGLDLFGRRADGSEFSVDISLSPLRGAEGVLLAAAIRDTTERRREEAERVESEQRFRAFLEFAPDAVVIIDTDGVIVIVNAQTEKLFGYARDELVGKRVEELLPERFRGAHVGHRRNFLTDPRTRPMGEGLSLYGLRKDGSEFPVDISLGALRTERGLLLVAAIRDITERKRLEDVRDAFIENAAHELRTPLSTLAGLGQVLAMHLREMSTQQVEESLAALRRQGERASTLVGNLLDLSQVDSGRATLNVRGVDLLSAVRGSIDSAPPPAGRSVDVAIEEGVRVRADPVRLEQVITNLLVNAYRYGGPHIGISALVEGPDVVVSVEDDGIGVSPDVRERLFEPFTRGKNAGAVSGSGIGLALVRRLVEAFGGAIWHESVDPHGARFLAKLTRG